MSKPQNRDEFRKGMAEQFANVLTEKGLAWRKEWRGTGAMAPQNGVTKACYRGCNRFWLTLVSMSKGYSDPRWLTMNQIQDRNGNYHPKEKWHLKKGSKATYVEYWYPYDTKDKKALTWAEYQKARKEEGRKAEEFRLLTKYTPVFNAADIEGIPEIKREETEGKNLAPDELIKVLSEKMLVPIHYDGGDSAYYSPMQDAIHLPEPDAFESEYALNATALHELSHSTGHPKRLNRPMKGMFGTPQYAYEELVAEMCSCFMGVKLGEGSEEKDINNHKAYVQSWIEAIREKPDTLVRAIKDAQNAANYMDYMAGLISEKEYDLRKEKTIELPEAKKRSRDEREVG